MLSYLTYHELLHSDWPPTWYEYFEEKQIHVKENHILVLVTQNQMEYMTLWTKENPHIYTEIWWNGLMLLLIDDDQAAILKLSFPDS